MRSSDGINVDGVRLAEGTSLYDTEHDRVLWISEIDDAGITVEPVTDYEVDRPTGWAPGEREHPIAEGTMFGVTDLADLIETGRFEVSP